MKKKRSSTFFIIFLVIVLVSLLSLGVYKNYQLKLQDKKDYETWLNDK